MSTIRPFASIHYAAGESREISTRLAPPYDVLDGADKERLLRQDPRNFVKIDLPHLPPKSAGPPEAYAQAASQLQAWLADGTLVRARRPALYVYHQRYTHEGTPYVRKMFFARLRLEPFGEGSLFPHERTFGGPKEDRLALTKATRANLSPIFGLYEDGENVVAQRLEAALPGEPLLTGTLDGVENRLWAVTEPGVIDEVARLMAPQATYIADGHHRTGTAMLYRDWLIERQGALPDDHPANFVLCVFCAMEDPGLLILPTHRVLPGVTVSVDALAGDGNVEAKPLEVTSPGQVIAALARLGPQAVGGYDAQRKAYFSVRPARPDLLDAYEPEHSAPWRRLGLAFLHSYLLERVIGPQLCDGREPEIQYIKSDADAVQAADETRGTALLMQPTTMAELRAVCTANDLMPQKSTFFYPKLASGLVVNPLEA